MSNNDKADVPSPWREFLQELDALLDTPVGVHCIGGFVFSVYYGVPRTTADVDYYSVEPAYCTKDIQSLAGQGSKLHKKHKIYFQPVGVTDLPEDYETRLVEMFANQFKKLRLYAPDPYDLILSKLERNSQKDRDDVATLATNLRLRPEILRERYEKELRPNLFNEHRHDLTLKLWIETCFEAEPA